jgi:hypothetical protein
MINRHLKRLDRMLRLHGEDVQLSREIGSTTKQSARVNVKAIVKTLGVESYLAGITQNQYQVILSPTELRRVGWPAAIPATQAFGGIPSGLLPTKEPTLPASNDWISVRGSTTLVKRVDSVQDRGECVRIEVWCVG